MSKYHVCALALSIVVSPIRAQTPKQQSPQQHLPLSAWKDKIDVSGIRIGMPAAQAKQEIQSTRPDLVIEPLKLTGSKRLSGWIATPGTPDCKKGGALACGELLRVEAIDDKVYSVSYTKSFLRGQSAPDVASVRAALQEQYGALVAPSSPSDKDAGFVERGFTTNGEETPEACVALSEPAAGGRWLYGFASACDWVFSAEFVRDEHGLVRTVTVLVGDAQAGYQALGGRLGSHKKALAEVVTRQAERGSVLAHRSSR